MTDKKTFGAFIKSKRIEKNYSQKELAELLFVTEGAISKWERGASYPDITLIGDICRVLEISEHEFLTASTDTAARKVQREAKKFRTIRGVWFWIPTIAYSLALLICFICNLAVNHTLSWFFIVLASLLCAYSFIPTFTLFTEEHKLQVFVATSYLSICLLPWNGLMKGGICTLVCAVMYYFVGYVVDFLLHTKSDHYYVDFQNWEQCINGNVQLLIFLSAALIGVVLLFMGLRMGKKA